MLNTCNLPDGRTITMRYATPADREGIQTLHRGLSSETCYLRYLTWEKHLSDEELAIYTENDPAKHMTLLATIDEAGEERIIGMAGYILPDGAERELAEPQILIADAYQGQGLGSHLLRGMVKMAYANGIKHFQIYLHPSNGTITHFVQKSGFPVKSEFSFGLWELSMELGDGHIADG